MDQRTIRFHFKEPFLDFPLIFGTANVSGAGWVVPAKYYQQVGADRFKQKPIGAGPYKLVSQEAGSKLELEAFADYYRPVHIKQFVMVSVPEATTRVAMLERGEADLIYMVPGELIDRVKNNPKLTLAPVLSGSWWLEFPGFQDPKNPFHDKRVRQAVSLALDRRDINEAEAGGMGKVAHGNWINDDVQYAIAWPEFERNLEQARRLMQEAGYANGFDVDWLTPVPAYYSRRAGDCAAAGNRHSRQTPGYGARGLLPAAGRAEGVARRADYPQWGQNWRSWSNWYEAYFKCGGFNSRDRICVQDLDTKFARYEASVDPAERQKLAEDIQRGILENLYLVPVFRHVCECLWTEDRGTDLEGYFSHHHHGVCVSLGRHQAEIAVSGQL